MSEKVFNVLFLCTGNATRGLIAEAQLNVLGRGRFKAYSAGSQPKGEPNPVAIDMLKSNGFPVDALRSKSWDEFTGADAPRMDYVLTLCDDLPDVSMPVLPGNPIAARWQVADPEAIEGEAGAKRQAIVGAAATLRKRIELFVSLPTQSLDRLGVQNAVSDIGQV